MRYLFTRLHFSGYFHYTVIWTTCYVAGEWNDEKRSGIVQKEKSTLYLCSCTVLRCLSLTMLSGCCGADICLRLYFSCASSSWVAVFFFLRWLSLTPNAAETAKHHLTYALVLSAVSWAISLRFSHALSFGSRPDEYFNGGYFSNACFLLAVFEQSHNEFHFVCTSCSMFEWLRSLSNIRESPLFLPLDSWFRLLLLHLSGLLNCTVWV